MVRRDAGSEGLGRDAGREGFGQDAGREGFGQDPAESPGMQPGASQRQHVGGTEAGGIGGTGSQEQEPETLRRRAAQERDAEELVGMPVVSTTAGKDLGRVKDVLFDPEEQALLGLMVTPTGGGTTENVLFIDREDIVGLGHDAVTVETDEALQSFTMQERAQEVVNSGIHLKGAKIITESGDELGTIDKILLGQNCEIVAYRASSGIMGLGGKEEVSSADVVKIGADAVIVRAM